MNLSADWIPLLADDSIEATHWLSIGHASAPDSEIMDYARQQGYAVLTHDLDFGILLGFARLSKPSVVQIRLKDVYPYVIGSQVVDALRLTKDELDAGALVTVGPQRTRIRTLPFASLE